MYSWVLFSDEAIFHLQCGAQNEGSNKIDRPTVSTNVGIFPRFFFTRDGEYFRVLSSKNIFKLVNVCHVCLEHRKGQY